MYIDLGRYVSAAEEEDIDLILTMQGVIKTGKNIVDLNFQGIFLDNNHCGTGHLDNFECVLIKGGQDWTQISTSNMISEGARSLHIFFSVTGDDEKAEVYLDDVGVYFSE
jgi:hypothetical protein